MLNDKYNNEEVFVVPFSETEFIDNGYTNTNDKNIYNKFDIIGKYILRSDAEDKKEVQQIIPYIIFRNQFKEYLVIKIDTDSKIKMSLGFCDHIKKEDGYTQPLFNRILSILTYEIRLDDYNTLKHVGYVRDLDKKNVSHLGIVFLMDCNKNDIITTKNKHYKQSWMSRNELIDKYGKFESWSKNIIDYLVDETL